MIHSLAMFAKLAIPYLMALLQVMLAIDAVIERRSRWLIALAWVIAAYLIYRAGAQAFGA